MNRPLRIEVYKKYLRDTDYQAIKFAEGEMTAEEYAPIRAKRQKWRELINKYESEIAAELAEE